MCVLTDNNPTPVQHAKPLWVTKWVDYSNKYGFGFQLSDKGVGVLFNDTTRMLLAPDGKYVTLPLTTPPPSAVLAPPLAPFVRHCSHLRRYFVCLVVSPHSAARELCELVSLSRWYSVTF